MLMQKLKSAAFIIVCSLGLIQANQVLADHHIDCTDPLNAGHSECAGVIDCNDPINLIYPQCKNGGGVTTPAPTPTPTPTATPTPVPTPTPTPVATPTPTPKLAPQEPVAVMNLSTTSGEAPLTINLNASASYDDDGQIVSYAWYADNGKNASGVQTSMTFTQAGLHTITLTVVDDQGLKASASRTISVVQTNIAASNQDCLAVYEPSVQQLSLPWVNLMSGESISASFSDVMLELLPNTGSELQFQVKTSKSTAGLTPPTNSDCVSTYNNANGDVSIPKVKAGSAANDAAYKNIRLKLIAPNELIFKLESLESVQ